jgi:hypothetical protein
MRRGSDSRCQHPYQAGNGSEFGPGEFDCRGVLRYGAHPLMHMAEVSTRSGSAGGYGCGGHEGMIYRSVVTPPSAIGLPLVGVTAHSISCGADKKVQVGARVGLLYVVYIEPLPAAYGVGKACEGSGVRPAALQLLF